MSFERVKVSVSVVVWNHSSTIEKCITSLLSQTHPNVEIIILDNNSSDDSRQILKKFETICSIHFNEVNVGFCGGHNKNFTKANGDFVLLANPDMIFESDYISNALKTFGINNKIGTVCGVLYSHVIEGYRYIIDGAGLKLTASRRFRLMWRGSELKRLPNSDFEVFGADGASPMYRRAMINDVSIDGSFFDELFFAHKEDHDISWRSQLAGWKTICCRSCLAYHPRSFKPGDLKVRRQISDTVKFHAAKNQLILILKNESIVSFLINFPFIFTHQALSFFYFLLFEPQSLKAYGFVLKNLSVILKNRRKVQRKNIIGTIELIKWVFFPLKNIN